MASLADKIRDQVSQALLAARGVAGVVVPADPVVGFTDLPVVAGVLRTLAQSCDECGSLVLIDRKAGHTAWHTSLVKMIISPPTLDSEPSTATRGTIPSAGH